jgi:leader peptidase (prepilin peptidase)/N-methyltransferase
LEILIFIFGIIVGSFINVVIHRVPLQKSVVTPKSSCPKCNTPIKPHHNVPIISWLLLKGKCSECGEKISIRYPIVEFFIGILAVLIFKKLNELNIHFLIDFALFSTLFALSVIDLDYKAVPDSLNLLALTLSFFSKPDILTTLTNSFIVMGGMSAIRFYLSYFLKKEAMGEGDIIVAGTIGAVLGIKLSIFAIFLGSLIALIPSLYFKYKHNEEELPFIPFLAFATFIVWYFDKEFMSFWSYIYG